jgi:polyisoprenoid-binding protein YceI
MNRGEKKTEYLEWLMDSALLRLTMKPVRQRLNVMRLALVFLLACSALVSASPADAPAFEITPVQSTVKFDVEASVSIVGKFSKWDAKLTFSSPELSTGVLDIKIQAASVDTGSGTKNGKLKGKDFFDVERNPLITFHSTKVEQTGPDTVAFDGDFMIRGVTKKEKVTFTVARDGTGSGTLKGIMAFDRKQYGMNSGIPFIKIADRVEVTLDLKAKRVSGPPVNLK